MYEPFSIVDVLLDENNPRFADPVGSQPEAINALLRLNSDKLLALMEHIVLKGSLDPTNPPIAMREGNDIIVLEGNRRAAAIKLLRNPDLANGDAVRQRIRRIRTLAEEAGKDPDGPGEITCYMVADREEARQWMELKHTGENEGVGTTPWNSYQSTTFRRRPGTAEDRAWLFVHAVVDAYDQDTALLNDVRIVRDNKFTNLARLISRAHVREQMQFTVDGDDVALTLDSPFATDVLRTVMADLKTKTVDEIKTSELIDEYIDLVVGAVRERYPEPEPDDDSGTAASGGTTSTTAGGGSGSAGTAGGTGTSGTSASGAGTGGRPTTRPPRLEPKIFYGLTLRNLNRRTATLLKQAQAVKIDTAAAVCAVMVRVVVEMAVTEVGVDRNWFADRKSLREKLRIALKKLDPNIDHSLNRDPALAMAWIKSQADAEGGGLGVDEMNAYVHSYLAEPGPANVRALSSAFKPFLQRLDDYAGENPVP